MTVTPFSVITSILLCNVYIIIIAFMCRSNGFIIRFSLVPLTLLIIAGIFRMICFIEFPSTIVVGSEVILPSILNFFNMELFTAYKGTFIIHIYNVILVIWIIGSIYNLHKYVYQSIHLNKYIRTIQGTDDLRIISCMDGILGKSRENMKVKIIQSEEISIPMITGYFKPVICLPDIQFSDGELKNILLHEWSHFLHKDSWVKLLMYIICSVFWWNPFVHLFRRELNHILEIQCDLSITSKMDEEARLNYLNGILKVIRSINKYTLLNAIPMNCATLFSTNKPKKIEQRFSLVLNYKSDRKQHIFPVFLLCTLILLSFFASYKIVLQPRTFSTVKAGYEETFTITPENSYLMINETGTYSLYSDDKYRFDITIIDGEPFSSLPIK